MLRIAVERFCIKQYRKLPIIVYETAFTGTSLEKFIKIIAPLKAIIPIKDKGWEKIL